MNTAIEFRAPWGKTLRTATVLSCVVLGIIFVTGWWVSSQESWFAALILIVTPILVLAAAAPFMVRGYVLTNDALIVRRLGWNTRLPLAGLASVTGDADAMRGAFRLFGNGGLLSFTGLFWSRRLKRFRAFATDLDRAVVLRYPQRTIVITPHDPQQFIMRARTLLKHAQFDQATAGRRNDA